MVILFKQEHVGPILEGRKTQTRRLWKRRRAVPGALHWAQTGYAKPETRFARLRILRVWQERLGDISGTDARAEGYDTQAFYLDAFYRINYGTEPNTAVDLEIAMDLIVWCVEFDVLFSVDKGGGLTRTR